MIAAFRMGYLQGHWRGLAFTLGLFLSVWLPSCACADDFQGSTHLVPFEDAPINYGKTPATGPVARLQSEWDSGAASLEWDEHHGYLPALLKALKVPVESQMLVFSKTSFQRDRISPATPRAVYFNDDVYVGYVPGSPLLEISMADPHLGGVFYGFDNVRTNRFHATRTDQCLECHAGAKTMGVPGHLLRSFLTDERGMTDQLSGAGLITHRTPLEERWGGWFVTGTHGDQRHRGNLIGADAVARQEREPNFAGNKPTLSDLPPPFDPARYPAATSDIVALMVHDHQIHMHNYLTRLNYEATIQLQAYGHCNYIKSPLEAFLRYLLFTQETPLTAPVGGSEAFRMKFEAQGPQDPQGRSLRQLDLKTRLFKYPCSYLIHSAAFQALPPQLKARIYQRLWAILSGADSGPDWQRLSADDRRAIQEILIATLPDLPSNWKL